MRTYTTQRCTEVGAHSWLASMKDTVIGVLSGSPCCKLTACVKEMAAAGSTSCELPFSSS